MAVNTHPIRRGRGERGQIRHATLEAELGGGITRVTRWTRPHTDGRCRLLWFGCPTQHTELVGAGVGVAAHTHPLCRLRLTTLVAKLIGAGVEVAVNTRPPLRFGF